MSLPKPEPGLVVRYSYLWSREAGMGRDEGAKDRPCAIVLAVRRGADDLVYVLPITHSAPANADDAIEIPRRTKARLGLDAEASWIAVTEANAFTWPGPDLRTAPGRGAESVTYGVLPPAFFRQVRDQFAAQVVAGRVRTTGRSS